MCNTNDFYHYEDKYNFGGVTTTAVVIIVDSNFSHIAAITRTIFRPQGRSFLPITALLNYKYKISVSNASYNYE